MLTPEISVLIPCFDGERFVGAAIDSVLAQSYVNVTVVAIDDGSTDGTSAVLGSYGSRITVLCHADGRNHGQAASLNLGLKSTNTELVAFMDCDDIWHPEKLRRQVEVLIRHEDIDFVYTNGYVIDEEGNSRYPILADDHCERNNPEELLLDCYIRTPSQVMVRRKALENAGLFKEEIIPDHDMWLRILENNCFHFLNEKLVGYRQHSGQVSHKNSGKMWRDGFLVLSDAMKRYPYPSKLRRKRLAVLNYRLGECSLRARKRYRAATHFLLACWYDPVRSAAIVMYSKGRPWKNVF